MIDIVVSFYMLWILRTYTPIKKPIEINQMTLEQHIQQTKLKFISMWWNI